MKNFLGAKLLLCLVFPAVFNVVFFTLLGTDCPTSVWVAYVFVHISYVALLLTKSFVPKGEDADSSGYSLFTISISYFILTLIAGGIFMYLKDESASIAIVTNIILTGIYLVIFIPHMLAGKKMQETDKNVESGRSFIDMCCVKVGLLKNANKHNEAVYNKLSEAYDIIHSSPVKTNPAISSVETSILTLLTSMENEANGDSLLTKTDELIKLFNTRNIMLKAH